MKRVKLMLLSLSILAVVGGTLAFTAKQGTFYCTAPTTSSSVCPAACPTLAQITTTTNANHFLCTTPSADDGTCKLNGVNLACGGTPINSTKE